MKAPAIVVVGEGMIELSQDNDEWRVHHGGDTLNIAIHLARFGFNPAFLSALGDDPFSEKLRSSALTEEGIDTSLVLTDPARGPDLYAIRTTPSGERSFAYWRRDSAASALFSHPSIEAASARCLGSTLFVFSLISLAILDEAGREALLELARSVRGEGGAVAFDGNYRPRLWESEASARKWRDRAIAMADIGLPTIDDESQLEGPSDAETVAHRWQALGCAEVVVKVGPNGCLLPDGGLLAPRERLSPLDTSGAGDAFGAGYLAGRMQGRSPSVSAARGHNLAGWVVMRRGAIPPKDQQAPYGLV